MAWAPPSSTQQFVPSTVSGFLERAGVMIDRRGSNGQRNRILNAMSNADLALLQPHLEETPLKFRQRLQSANRQVRAVYFPESGIASVVAVGGGERRQAEVALVGREGMTGIPVVHGADRSPCDVFVQMEGAGHCIGPENLQQVIEESATALKVFLRYAHVFAVQSAYTALANARGNIEERLARWLLMTRDRVDDDEMVLTHEFIALMLGVRRAGVTGALQAFEGRGLIETARGSVTVRDRDGLEETANGLYGVPEAEFERLFG
jgi:CRP-like cAMP-binding protein